MVRQCLNNSSNANNCSRRHLFFCIFQRRYHNSCESFIWNVHTCHKRWTKICEVRQNFKGDLTKFCEIFLNITLQLPKYSLSFFSCKKPVKTWAVCDLCLILYKICCKMVWKFCEIWIFYGNGLPDGSYSMRFYLTVWDMACMNVQLYFLCKIQQNNTSDRRLLQLRLALSGLILN